MSTPKCIYEIWGHEYLGEFAVRIEDGPVTGACPISLHFACDPDGRLPDLEYNNGPATLYRFLEYPEQFCQFEPWLHGKRLPARQQADPNAPNREGIRRTRRWRIGTGG
jgi:hypothetical protein